MDNGERYKKFSKILSGASLIVGLFMALYFFVYPVLANPPGSPYAPGATLDPGCSPGDPNCTVYPPLTTTLTTSTAITMGTSTLNFGTSTLFIDAFNTRVGIGTSTPSYTLHVVGNTNLEGNVTTTGNLYIAGVTNFGASIISNLTVTSVTSTNLFATNGYITNAYFNTIASGTWAGNIIANTHGGTGQNSSGWTGFAYVNNGTWATSTLTTSTIIGLPTFNAGTAGQISYYAGATSTLTPTSAIFIDSNGYVGIGTTNPSALFTVAGTGSFGNGVTTNTISGLGVTSTNIYSLNYTGTWNGSLLSILRGGTNSTTIAGNGSVLYSDGSMYNATAVGTDGYILMSVGAGTPIWISTTSFPNLSVVGNITTGNWNSGSVSTTNLYASGTINLAGGLTFTTASGTVGSSVSSTNIYSPNYTGTWNGSLLSILVGGTNSTTIASNGSIIYSDGSMYNATAVGTVGYILMSAGAGTPIWISTTSFPNLSVVGNITTGNWNSGSVSTTNLYASGTVNFTSAMTFNTATGTAGSSVSSTNIYSGNYTGTWNGSLLSILRGGTNSTTIASNGSVIYSDGSMYNATAVGTDGQFLQSNGTGAPTWTSTGTLGIPGIGTAGQIPYYATNGFALTATSAIFIAADGYVGIGTANPSTALTVAGVGSFGNGVSTSTIGGIGVTSTNIYSSNYTGTWNGSLLSILRGGTNSSTIASNGSVIYSDGTSYNATAVGTLGYILMSAGAGAPVWINTSTWNTAYNWGNWALATTSFPNLSVVGNITTGNWNSGSVSTTNLYASGTINLAGGVTFTTATGTAGSSVSSTNIYSPNYTGTWAGLAIAIANGGTNSSTIASNGSIIYSDGSMYNATAVGTTGQFLQSNGAGAPTWTSTGTLGIPGVGTAGQIPYYAANGFALTATSAIFIAADGNVGIGTGSLAGAKFKIVEDSSAILDNYNDLSKIITNANVVAVSGKLQLTEAVCGNYTVQGAGGLTYGTVFGPDGKCWLDRNLGATQVAVSDSDANAYGYYYQWGRPTDGHQIENSGTTGALSTLDVPGHSNFITSTVANFDWKTNATKNDALWGYPGIGGANNVCPTGWHVPTQSEWATVVGYFSPQTSVGAFNSTLKLPLAGYRNHIDAALNNRGSYGHYWSSSPSGSDALNLTFNSGGVYPALVYNRANGFSVRCVKD